MDAVFEDDIQKVLDSLSMEQADVSIDIICNKVNELKKKAKELELVWDTETSKTELKQINELISELNIDKFCEMIELLQCKQVTYDFTSMDA